MRNLTPHPLGGRCALPTAGGSFAPSASACLTPCTSRRPWSAAAAMGATPSEVARASKVRRIQRGGRLAWCAV
eukprot:1257465-Prymnesium_polylepis.1